MPNLRPFSSISTLLAAPSRVALCLPLCALLLGGCGLKNLDEPTPQERTKTFLSVDEKLLLSMTAERLEVPAEGGVVPVRLSLRNETTGPVTLNFNSGQRFDVYVQEPSGKALYRWSEDRSFPLAIGEVYLAPGQTLSQTLEVPLPPERQALPEGYYEFIGVLTASQTLATPPLTISYGDPTEFDETRRSEGSTATLD